MKTPISTNELARATIRNHFAIVSRRLLVFAAGFGLRTTAGPAALRLAVTGHSMVRGGNVAGGGLCAGPAKVRGASARTAGTRVRGTTEGHPNDTGSTAACPSIYRS